MVKLGNILKNIVLSMLFRSIGESIFERNWDNLIILDACRYDTFKEVIKEFNVDGRLEVHTSLGSDTTEFLLKNFSKDRYDDIVYVTANPFVSMILKYKVYKIVPVWDYGWDEELKTVPPIQVYYYAFREYVRHPEKKFIIHFMQPHYPYMDYQFKPMMDALKDLRNGALSKKTREDFVLPFKLSRVLRVIKERMIYHARFYIGIDPELHRKAYTNNLRYVLPYAIKLTKLLPGVNVITADHGEAFGEKRHPLIPVGVYGHLPEIHIQVLVKVPWFIVENKISADKALEAIKRELKGVERELLKIRVRKRLRSHLKGRRGA